jgi:hypothetical protein
MYNNLRGEAKGHVKGDGFCGLASAMGDGTNLTVKLRWATAGVPHVTVVGCAGGLAIKMHQRLGTQPTAAFRAVGIRVYRSVQG